MNCPPRLNFTAVQKEIMGFSYVVSLLIHRISTKKQLSWVSYGQLKNPWHNFPWRFH